MKRRLLIIVVATICALLLLVSYGNASFSQRPELPEDSFKPVTLDYSYTYRSEATEVVPPLIIKESFPTQPPPTKPPIVTPAPTPKSTPKPTPAPAPKSTGWRWPVKGRLSGRFSARHPAIDIVKSCGTPVIAAIGGKVIFAGWKNNHGGYQIWIDSGKLAEGYYHLSKIYVKRGQSVAAGKTIGRVGTSGHSTGCHLHFEVWVGNMWNGGYRVNPLRYL